MAERPTQCFVIKRGTDFDKAVKQHFKLLDRWGNVFPRVSQLLGQEITKLGFYTHELVVEPNEIKNEETKKLFKKTGELKANSKAANQLRKEFKQIIKEEGLEEYEELRFINFAYGVMRMRGQSLESFVTDEYDVYYKADFDLEKKTNGLVIPISEVEYQEKYLEEIKKKRIGGLSIETRITFWDKQAFS